MGNSIPKSEEILDGTCECLVLATHASIPGFQSLRGTQHDDAVSNADVV